MKKTFNIINIIVSLLIVVLLFFVSIFYLGSEDQLNEELSSNFWGFILDRFVFEAIIFLLGIFILFLIGLGFKKHVSKDERKKILLKESLLFFIISIVFIALSLTVF